MPALDSLLLGTVYGKSSRSGSGLDLRAAGNVRQRVEQACARLNSTAPHQIDESTYLVSCRVMGAKEVSFDLVLKGFDPQSPGVASFMESAKPILEKSICRNPDVSALGKQGISLVYSYRIRDTQVLTLSVKPEQCVAALRNDG